MNLEDVNFTKGDFFRFYRQPNGELAINKIKVLTLVFVKHIIVNEDGEETLTDKTYTFVNPLGKRISSRTKVSVQTRHGAQDAIVVSSIKIPQKYVGELFYAMNGFNIKSSPIQPVLGIYKEHYVPLLDESDWDK